MIPNKKTTIKKSATHFLEQQRLLRLYLQGKINKKTLDENGIKLKQPV